MNTSDNVKGGEEGPAETVDQELLETLTTSLNTEDNVKVGEEGSAEEVDQELLDTLSVSTCPKGGDEGDKNNGHLRRLCTNVQTGVS